jgi:spermidine/putrescine transport system permease protein
MVMKWVKRIYASLIFVFLYAPIAVLVIFSFNDAKSTAKWEGFTLRWYQTLLENDYIMKSLYYTILIAVISSLLATVIGTFAAFGIHYAKPWRQKLIMNINAMPILNPDIVTGISLMTLFVWMNLERGLVTMLLAHMTFSIPYVILSVLPKMKQMPADVLEAALDLGATPWMAFKKVIFPEITPGIISGALIAFTLSIDDFVISFFTTGNGVSNLSIAIYSMARRGIKPEINALSTLMFITILILLLAINKRTSNIEEL